MIVDPDFVDHWKTRMLVSLLGDDECAPLYVIRLWAHCQMRKSWIFDMPSAALKGVCKARCSAAEFESAMVESGFVERIAEGLVVCGWNEYNAALIAAWSNGSKGGRPRKIDNSKPMGNPRANPNNPWVTHGVTDKIREDKKRKETTRFDAKRRLSDLGVDEQVIEDWLDLRKRLRAPVTETALSGIEREAKKSGVPLQEALRICCQRGWRGFDADWIKGKSMNGASHNPFA